MGYLQSITEKLDLLAVRNSKPWRSAIPSPRLNMEEREEEQEKEAVYQNKKDSLKHYILSFEEYTAEIVLRMDKKRKDILKTLEFGQIHDRELAIPEAHRKTFQWIFDTPKASTDTDFVRWLRTSQNGVFWIKGKAGSGKSTLMKFITEHPTTDSHLKSWAGWDKPGTVRDDLVIAKHYFWSPGTPIQKSQEGLLRSLLVQILSKRPQLIERVCEDRWSAKFSASFDPWTWTQLAKAMDSLSTQNGEEERFATGSSLKICLFIDGLDEYEGDHTDLISLLNRISGSANVKICTSSRPWVDFIDAFDKSPWKVCTHDLTLQDICRYIQDKLEENEKFKRLQTRFRDEASDLIDSIVARSDGVFLWVFLVVQSVLRGLRNEDNILTLRQRVDALPSDLERFFERILDSVEDIYRERAARLFLTLSYARRSFPVFTFLFFNFGDQTAATLAHEVAFLSD